MLPLGTLGQVSELVIIECVRCFFAEFFEETVSSLEFGQRDIYPSLETSSNGRIKIPGQVSRAKYQHFITCIMSNSIHLHQKLSLHSLASLIISLTSIAGHGVDLIDEDDTGFLFSGHFEEVFDYLFGLADVFAHDVAAGYAEEGGL